MLPANRLGPEDSVVQAVAWGEHASFRYAPLHVLPPVLPCQGRVENVQELAADAYPCIMVWVFGPPHTRMWHDASCTNPQLPSDVVIPTTASVPSCSEPSRTSLAVALAAPSLTAPARDGFHSIVWVGTKKRLPGRTKKLRYKKMDRTLGAPP